MRGTNCSLQLQIHRLYKLSKILFSDWYQPAHRHVFVLMSSLPAFQLMRLWPTRISLGYQVGGEKRVANATLASAQKLPGYLKRSPAL